MANKEIEILLRDLNIASEKNNGNNFQRVLKQPAKLLWSKVLEKFCLATKKEKIFKAKLFWGDEMDVLFPEHVSCFLYRYGFFEKDLTNIVLTHLKPGQTFFDIGTHFGYYSMLASRIVGDKGCVHSFEPTIETFKVAAGNLASKNNVKMNNLAAWSEETTLKFIDYGVKWAAFNSLYGAKLEDSIVKKMKPKEYHVSAISIDKYTEKTGIKPDFIKIDAENAEFDILTGMVNTIEKVRPIITLEVGDVNEGLFENSNACVTFLVERGYKVLEIKNGVLRQHGIESSYAHTNLLFVPGKEAKST